jgi:hypothetical protein
MCERERSRSPRALGGEIGSRALLALFSQLSLGQSLRQDARHFLWLHVQPGPNLLRPQPLSSTFDKCHHMVDGFLDIGLRAAPEARTPFLPRWLDGGHGRSAALGTRTRTGQKLFERRRADGIKHCTGKRISQRGELGTKGGGHGEAHPSSGSFRESIAGADMPNYVVRFAEMPRYVVRFAEMPRYDVRFAEMPRYVVRFAEMPRYDVRFAEMPRYDVRFAD